MMGSLDAISPVKSSASKADDDKLPPLLSMVVEGLPPYAESKFVREAESYFKQYVKRYAHLPSLDVYCRQCLFLSSNTYSGVLSLARLVAMSTFYALVFLLDDLFFDIPDKNLMDPYGIPRTVLSSPQKMQEYVDHLVAVFGQQSSPHSSNIETMMCEVGREISALSNPEWFQEFLLCFDEYFRVSVASHADIVAGENSCFQDLRSYTEMRAANGGGKVILLLTEFASDTYVPAAMRSDPYMQKVTIAATIFAGFVNDVFSYHKESTEEGNPRNLITVLMESEGKSFLQAAQRAIELVKEYANSTLELEGEAASNSVLQNHASEIRVFVAGHVYFYCMCERYRQPDSVFPELRDRSTSWEAFVESSTRRRTIAVV